MTTTNNTKKDLTWVIRNPRITEKAAIQAEGGAYVFEVSTDATKGDIALAIAEVYKVNPIAVNITRIPAKKVVRRKAKGTKTGYKAGRKKAYVYLKKGETIDFV